MTRFVEAAKSVITGSKVEQPSTESWMEWPLRARVLTPFEGGLDGSQHESHPVGTLHETVVYLAPPESDDAPRLVY